MPPLQLTAGKNQLAKTHARVKTSRRAIAQHTHIQKWLQETGATFCVFVMLHSTLSDYSYAMALPLKKSEVICWYDLQYRWTKRSTEKGVEVRIELNEFPDGQMIIAQCPRVFRPDMVEAIIEFGRENGWQPEAQGEPITVRLTKRGLTLIH